MKLAVRKAEETGVGWVCVGNANHFGAGVNWVKKAMKCNCIGIACSNASPTVAPTRSRIAAIGTNPICVGIPGNCHSDFVLDIATSAGSLEKIEFANKLGKLIPDGWALDKNGKITTDPKKALEVLYLVF